MLENARTLSIDWFSKIFRFVLMSFEPILMIIRHNEIKYSPLQWFFHLFTWPWSWFFVYWCYIFSLNFPLSTFISFLFFHIQKTSSRKTVKSIFNDLLIGLWYLHMLIAQYSTPKNNVYSSEFMNINFIIFSHKIAILTSFFNFNS